jgi:hypothetical protein
MGVVEGCAGCILGVNKKYKLKEKGPMGVVEGCTGCILGVNKKYKLKERVPWVLWKGALDASSG